MSLLSFMRQKSLEKGIGTCPHCGKQDIYYSILEVCGECFQPIDSRPAIKKLQFAIEVFNEFLENYDDFIPTESKRNLFNSISEVLVDQLKNENTFDNTHLICFQSVCKHIGTLGGESFGGSLAHATKKISVKKGMPNETEVTLSLTALMFAINYIIDFPVKNEFILKTKPGKFAEAVKSGKSKPIQSEKKANKGCLGVVVIFMFAIVAIFISIKCLL